MPKLTVDQPADPQIMMSRKEFQALHSAARAMFRESMKSDNHSAQALIYLQLLDAAIDAGHEALGTHRPSADTYVELISGISKIQAENAQRFLENKGLTIPE